MTSPISARDSLAPYLLAAGRRGVAVNYDHDQLAADAGFINGITLSINGGKYLS
jgi:hypothetical protein